MIDVACSYDHLENVIAARRLAEVCSYYYRNSLKEKGFPVCYDSFVVDLLGMWDPKHNHLLCDVGIGRKYGALFTINVC